MFVPEGYLPLHYIKEVCGYIARESYPPIPLDDKGDDGFAFANVKPDPRSVLYSHLIFDRFVSRYCEDFFVFQYPNLLLRAPDELFFTDRIYDGPCPQDIEEAEAGLEHVRTNVEISFLTSDLRVDVSLAGRAKELAQFYGLGRFIEDARLVNGAVLCWRSELKRVELSAALNEFRDEIYWAGNHPDFPPLVDSTLPKLIEASIKPARGRPNKKRIVAQIYNSIFPDGHEAAGKTWKEARIEVEHKLGASIADDTLKRGLKDVQK
jgi:hypothetical protein